MQKYTWRLDERFRVTTDLSSIDLKKTAEIVAEQDWAVASRPTRMTMEAMRNSETFVCLDGDTPAGFFRLVTDYVTAAYVTDVNIANAYKGMGLSKFMLACAFEKHPVFRRLRRCMLITPNAHGLYAKFGFGPCAHPEENMERLVSYDEAYAAYFARRAGNGETGI